MERFAQRYPDVAADDEEAFYGRLSDEFDRIDRSDAAQRELGKLLAGDPRSAGFLMVMRRGGNPMEYLIEQYGDDSAKIRLPVPSNAARSLMPSPFLNTIVTCVMTWLKALVPVKSTVGEVTSVFTTGVARMSHWFHPLLTV